MLHERDIYGRDPRRWPAVRRRLWTPAERRAVAGLVLLAAGAFLIMLWQRPATLADPPPPRAPLGVELRDRLDPNVATLGQLATLPGIGPSKAEAIIAHRERAPERFGEVGDLARVHGIGPATVAKLRPYLMFPPPGEPSGGQAP